MGEIRFYWNVKHYVFNAYNLETMLPRRMVTTGKRSEFTKSALFYRYDLWFTLTLKCQFKVSLGSWNSFRVEMISCIPDMLFSAFLFEYWFHSTLYLTGGKSCLGQWEMSPTLTWAHLSLVTGYPFPCVLHHLPFTVYSTQRERLPLPEVIVFLILPLDINNLTIILWRSIYCITLTILG